MKDVSIHLWKAELPRPERKVILGRLRTILRILRNSAKRHLVDMDFERLRWRNAWTLGELKKLSQELAGEGLTGAARFIRNSANYMASLRQAGHERGERAQHQQPD